MNQHIQCTRCIMDTSDAAISFDPKGVCSHCLQFEKVTRKDWYPNEDGARRLSVITEKIRIAGQGQEYDCILGLSGGVDSSYLALLVKDLNLRPLVVHVDAGWNSELAVANIEKIVKYCKFDLHTHVVDWEEMRDLHLAYLRSGISNQDVPQDHVFFASLYHFAVKNKIKYILSGGNIATEGIMASSWHEGSAMDSINLRAIHAKYGQRSLRTYRTIAFWQYYLYFPFVKKMRTLRPLNFVPYNKIAAIKELEDTIGWKNYGRKHGESLFTKVFQNDYLVRKYGYDKRKPHLSSLIVSGQLSREDALAQLRQPLYDESEREVDLNYFCKKLRITRQQYEDFVCGTTSSYYDYANWEYKYKLVKKLQAVVERYTTKRVNVYS